MAERKLYKIGYLTQALGITARTIRYYEQFGLLPHVKRSDGKMRLYTDEDVSLIKEIRRLQKESLLPFLVQEKIASHEFLKSYAELSLAGGNFRGKTFFDRIRYSV